MGETMVRGETKQLTMHPIHTLLQLVPLEEMKVMRTDRRILLYTGLEELVNSFFATYKSRYMAFGFRAQYFRQYFVL